MDHAEELQKGNSGAEEQDKTGQNFHTYWFLIWCASHHMMCVRYEGPRHKSRNEGALGTISQLALNPLCKQVIDKLASTHHRLIHSTVWQSDQCMLLFFLAHACSNMALPASLHKLTDQTDQNSCVMRKHQGSGTNVLGKEMCSF